MTTFTSGPWSMSRANKMDGASPYEATVYFCPDFNHPSLGWWAVVKGETAAQTDADARLIKEAPELLDLVKRFVSACDAYLPPATHQAFCGLFAAARASIAIVEGATNEVE